MRRSIILLIVSVLLVHLPDQLSDSYLARFGVQAAPSWPQDKSGSRQLHATDKLLLLTNGLELKLFPLDPDELSPTGGHYLIKPTNFDLSDQPVVDSLKANKRYLNWLQHKHRLTQAAKTTGGRQHSSILPLRSSNGSLSDEELYSNESGWRKPLISSLGYFFDARFCENVNETAAARQKRLQNKISAPSDCFVIYWLDKANNAFHMGATELNFNNKIDLLPASSDSRSENVLEVRQFGPLDLCQQASFESTSCHSISVHVESESLKLHAALINNGTSNKPVGRLLSGLLEPAVSSKMVTGLKLAQKSVAQSGEFFDALKVSSRSVKNLLERSDSKSQLLFLDGKAGLSTKIAAIDLDLATSGGGGEITASNELSNRRVSSVLDVQWETTKLKVRRSKSNKLDEPFSVVSMGLNSQCGLFWLTSDNELYAFEMDQTRTGGTKFLGKLGANRPLIRSPIVEMQLHDSSLFFIDSTRRSLMAVKLPQLRASHKREQQSETSQSPYEQPLGVALTHRVLLVEMLPIQDFELVVLPSNRQGSWKNSDNCPTPSKWRHTEASIQRPSGTVQSHSQLNEASSTSVADVVPEAVGRELAEAGAEARIAQATVLSVSLAAEDDDDFSLNFDKVQMAMVICLLMGVILLLACINYILWRQRAILVAARAIEIGQTTHNYQLDEKPPTKQQLGNKN